MRKPSLESAVLIYYFLFPILRPLIFSHLPLGDAIMNGILVICALLVIHKRPGKRSQFLDIPILYGVIFLLFAMKFWTDPSMHVWLRRDYGVRHMLMTGGIFSYLVFRIQKDPKEIYRTMKHAVFILGAYYVFQSLEVIRNGYWTVERFGETVQMSSNMSWSYGVLLVISVFSCCALLEKNVLYCLPVPFGLLGIVLYGSRGALIAYVLGALLYGMVSSYGRKRFRLYASVMVIVAAVGLSFERILTALGTWQEKFGLNSRFIDKLVHYESIEGFSSGRMKMWRTVLGLLRENPIVGYGVMGERNTIYGLGLKWGYCHNFFLELMVAFGCVIGSILLIILFYGVIRFFRFVKDRYERLVFILFLTVAFELLFSNTMWLHFCPWILMALYANHFQKTYLRDGGTLP